MLQRLYAPISLEDNIACVGLVLHVNWQRHSQV
jgi:hypothetical protein